MEEIVKMPQLGESVTEGTIGQWLKNVGDPIEKYESLLEVMTDKVNAEVPAPVTGVVSKILVDEGTTVSIGEALCVITVEGVGDAADDAVEEGKPIEPEVAPEKPSVVSMADGRGRYSPAVRRLAEEHGVDLGKISGSGAGGRVTRHDVVQATEKQAPVSTTNAAVSPSPSAPASPPSSSPVIEGAPAVIDEDDRIEPLSSVRKLIASRMVRSKQTVPHAWLMVEVDVTGLVSLRDTLKAEFKQREGISLTYLPFMMRAVVEGLRSVPALNAQWNGDSLVYKKHINLGMAAATERGLVVPVVKNADQKNIVGLSHATQDLARKARTGKLSMDDLNGGTFTVDNTGAVGTVLTYPIINAPEVAIVTLESIVRRPVVIGDMIGIRSMVNVCLSFDHRVVDGSEAGQFLQIIKKELEGFGPNTSIY